MGDVVLFSGGANVPAFAKQRAGELSEMSKALAGGGDNTKRISIKGGVFRLVAGSKEIATVEERYLDVVIVNAAPKVGRTWYAKAYTNDTVTVPSCWSPDGTTSSEESAERQSVLCADCPKNVAGSGQNNSKACRYQQSIAVVLANNMEGDVLKMALPATSIFGKEEGEKRPLQAYARFLAAQSVDVGYVVTQMRFDTKSESPKLYFKPVRWLTDDEYVIAQTQGATDDSKKAVTMHFPKPKEEEEATPEDKEAAEKELAAMPGKKPAAEKPVAAAKPVKPQPKPKVEVTPTEEDEDESPAEPEKRQTAKDKPSPVKAKGNLAALVDDWEDS